MSWATTCVDEGENEEASIGSAGMVSRPRATEGDCSAAPDTLMGDAGASRRHKNMSGTTTGGDGADAFTGRDDVEVVSRAQMPGARTWAEEGEWLGVSMGESAEAPASPLKALGAVIGSEGVFSRRHRKISGATREAEVSMADVVCNDDVSWR